MNTQTLQTTHLPHDTNTSSLIRIAILDDYLQLSAKHLARINFSRPAQYTIFNDKQALRTGSPPSEKDIDALVHKLTDFDVISTMRERTQFPGDLLRRLPQLKLLLTTGTQHSTYDITTATKMGIVVATAPGKGRTDLKETQRPNASRDITKGSMHPTTQHTWALILALVRNVAQDDYTMKYKQGWQTSMATGLTGKTLGICGLGRLGASTARVGILAWGMKVICWSANLTQTKADEMAVAVGLPVQDVQGEKTFQVVSKSDLFRQSHVLSLHYALSSRSKGVVGKEDLSVMRSDAFFVNTARGPLVDEDALYDVLDQGKIAGAALDVYEIEPLPEQDRWRSTKWDEEGRSRLILTPHMGYVEENLMETWYEETVENIERFVDGQSILHRLN